MGVTNHLLTGMILQVENIVETTTETVKVLDEVVEAQIAFVICHNDLGKVFFLTSWLTQQLSAVWKPKKKGKQN